MEHLPEPNQNGNENVDIDEQPASPASTVLLTPTTPETETDTETDVDIGPIDETSITSRSNIRRWNTFTRALVADDSSVLNNVELTSRHIKRMVKTLKQYPYTIQYKIITYVLPPDYPTIYSRHSRWPEEDVREHSYWVACELLDLISRTHHNYIVENQINCGLALIRRGSMTNEDFDMIWPHFTGCLYRLRSTGYLWCKILIAFMLGMDRDEWEGPLRNHMRKMLTEFHIVSILRAIHTNHVITISDDKHFTMLFKWLGFEANLDGEQEVSMPRAFSITV